jgi:hypothetical protein
MREHSPSEKGVLPKGNPTMRTKEELSFMRKADQEALKVFEDHFGPIKVQYATPGKYSF